MTNTLPKNRSTAWVFKLLVLLLAIPLTGCSAETTESPTPVHSRQKSDAQEGITSAKRSSLPAAILAGKVEFRIGEGEEVFSFKPKDDGAACKFYDAEGKELCKFSFGENKLKAKSPSDEALFELKAKDDKLMIKDATGEQELFKLKFKGDTIDFYAPNERRLYRIKKQDYGWRLEDNNDVTLFRAKKHEDKMVLRDTDDKTVLYSKEIPGTLGLVFFRIKELTPEQQAACCVMFMDK